MQFRIFIITVFLLVINIQGKEFPGNGVNSPFSIEALQRHLQFLGSDLFEGRGTGTMGGNLAAKYLALEFDKMNLIPLGSNGTYYQYIPMHGSTPLPSSKLIINNSNDTVHFKLGEDYVLYKSGEQTFIPNYLPMVFVGYGIVAPEFDYNDYQSIDVDGKIAVMLEGEPTSNDNEYFDGELPTIYSYPESKQRIAISRGARGCIIIPSASVNWQKLKNSFSFEDVTLAYSVTANLSFLINPASAEVLFKNSAYSLEEIYRMHVENRIVSFPLKSELSFRGDFRERDFVAPNIIGMLRGSDPDLSDSYLIISAHYDHLGIGPVIKGDSIYNGVFDNAIGSAALLEIAKAFTLNNTPKRSVIFALVTGEEKGLLGSIYYTENPVVPLYKTIANVNIDGIALFDKFKSIVGVGCDISTIKDFLIETAAKFNVNIVSIPPQFDEFESFSKSDQMSFALAGIPSILISEGPDYENLSKQEGMNKLINYSTEIYHTPFDDLNQEMNFDAAIEHINIIFDICTRLSDSQKTPEWNTGTPFINARLHSRAEKR